MEREREREWREDRGGTGVGSRRRHSGHVMSRYRRDFVSGRLCFRSRQLVQFLSNANANVIIRPFTAHHFELLAVTVCSRFIFGNTMNCLKACSQHVT